MHLIQIPTAADGVNASPLEKLWPQVTPFLKKAVELSGGTTTLKEEYEALAAHRKQLWVIVVGDGRDSAISAAGITSLQLFQNTGLKIANIEMLGGENMKAWFSLKDQFESWAKNEGCSEVRLYARKAWVKHLPDYKLAAYVMVRKLSE